MRKRILMALGAVVMLAGAEAQEWCNIWKAGKVVKSVAVAEIDSITVKRAKVDGAIDLGLESGTAWAASNVGATDPGESGTFFAWGETEAKPSYTEENSKWYGKEVEELMAMGVLDANGYLTAKYDAATANMGDGWRMPTSKELDELIALENVDTVYNGVGGRMFIGKNGNTMFIAYSGFVDGIENKNLGVAADLWASGAGGSKYGTNLYAFDEDADWSGTPRFHGCPVRAVRCGATSDYVCLHKGGKVSAEIEADSVTFGKKFVDYIKLMEGRWIGVKEVDSDGEEDYFYGRFEIADGKFDGHQNIRMSGDTVWFCEECYAVVVREITDETLVFDVIYGDGDVVTRYFESARKTEEYMNAIAGEWKWKKRWWYDEDGDIVDEYEYDEWNQITIKTGFMDGNLIYRVAGDTIWTNSDDYYYVVKEKSENRLVLRYMVNEEIWWEGEFEKQGRYVDLGLKSGTLWARMNVGAKTYSSESGNYYTWGETEPKSVYTKETSKWEDATEEELRDKGVIDENGNLTAAYDAATANWGNEWRMPTKEEMEELFELENVDYTLQDTISGRLFIGNNGEVLFLPYAGEMIGEGLEYVEDDVTGFFWAATAEDDDSYYSYWYHDGTDWDYCERYYGMTIRPVLKKKAGE